MIPSSNMLADFAGRRLNASRDAKGLKIAGGESAHEKERESEVAEWNVLALHSFTPDASNLLSRTEPRMDQQTHTLR